MVSGAKIGQTDSECRTERWCREPLNPKWIPVDELASLQNQLRVSDLCVFAVSASSLPCTDNIWCRYLFVMRSMAVTVPVRDLWLAVQANRGVLLPRMNSTTILAVYWFEAGPETLPICWFEPGPERDTAYESIWGRTWDTTYMLIEAGPETPPVCWFEAGPETLLMCWFEAGPETLPLCWFEAGPEAPPICRFEAGPDSPPMFWFETGPETPPICRFETGLETLPMCWFGAVPGSNNWHVARNLTQCSVL